MPEFNRFDIVEAHYVMEVDWHVSGVLQERPSNRRRQMSTDFQISRFGHVGYSVRNGGWYALTDNGKAIYAELCERYGYDMPSEYIGHPYEYDTEL